MGVQRLSITVLFVGFFFSGPVFSMFIKSFFHEIKQNQARQLIKYKQKEIVKLQVEVEELKEKLVKIRKKNKKNKLIEVAQSSLNKVLLDTQTKKEEYMLSDFFTDLEDFDKNKKLLKKILSLEGEGTGFIKNLGNSYENFKKSDTDFRASLVYLLAAIIKVLGDC